MYELYQKVNKSNNNLYGSRKIEDNENPFLDGPCMLCWAAQDMMIKEVFGTVKTGMKMARVRTRGDNGANYSADKFPVKFLAVKYIPKEDTSKSMKGFIDKYLVPILKDKENASRNLRNINIMCNCNATERIIDLENGMIDKMRDLGYTEQEIDTAMSQICSFPIETGKELANFKSTTIAFSDVNDGEVDITIHNKDKRGMFKKFTEKSKFGETIKTISDNVAVYAINGTGKHGLAKYKTEGKLMPVMISRVISNALENSIVNFQNQGEFKQITLERLVNNAKKYISQANKGVKLEDIYREFDSDLEYTGANKLSIDELAQLDTMDELCDKELKVRRNNRHNNKNDISINNSVANNQRGLAEDNKKKQEEILKEQREIYQGNMKKEENNGNIKMIDISTLSNEELENTFFHYSLKKDKNSIDNKGLEARIGRNSKGIDKEKSIFFSKGIEGALETWDVWLKWRADRLFNPYYQKENKDIREAIEDGTATKEEKQEYYYKCEQWNKEFMSGAYKDDKEKLDFLFKFQTDEMFASNYYRLDLIEGDEFSFDEVDQIKSKKISNKDNPRETTQYKMFATMFGEYSNLESDKVDKWNMHTILGKQVNIEPERIKQLVLPNGKNDVLSVVQFLYDKYKEITPKEQQVQFDLLDKYMEYVKEKTQNKKFQGFNRNDRIDEASTISHFHDQKSDTFFRDKSNGVYSISDDISGNIRNMARANNQKARDLAQGQSELKEKYKENKKIPSQDKENKDIRINQ